MKILYYSAHPQLNLSSKSGYGTHMREMIKAFRSLGHEVETLIMGGEEVQTPTTSPNQVSQSGIKTLIKGLIPSILWSSAKDFKLVKFDQQAKKILQQKVEAYQPDMIYERSAYLQTSGVEIARSYQTPHVMEINSPHLEEIKTFQGGSLYANKAFLAEKLQLESSDILLPVSSALKTKLSEVHEVPLPKFEVIPNAIDLEKLAFSTSEVDKIKEQYQLDNQLVIGFVGSIFPWHGLDKLINAFSTAKLESAKLLIVGDGEILSDLKELAKEKGVADSVIFTGKVSHTEVFNHIECMDITVMVDSNWYGSPVKIFEYGGMNKAIIAPDNIPVRDVMEPQKDGLLIKPNATDIIQAIKKLADDPALRIQMAASFYQKVLSQHQWKHNAEKVIQRVEEIIKAK